MLSRKALAQTTVTNKRCFSQKIGFPLTAQAMNTKLANLHLEMIILGFDMKRTFQPSELNA